MSYEISVNIVDQLNMRTPSEWILGNKEDWFRDVHEREEEEEEEGLDYQCEEAHAGEEEG